MAKNKKHKKPAVLNNSMSDNVVESFMADAVLEVLNCTDGRDLVHKHMEMGVAALHAYVTLIFASLLVDKYESDEFEEPAQPVLDYLCLACTMLGMSKVAEATSRGIEAAMDAFREAPVDLDEKSANNAKAFDLLIK